jgi:hypothetical protein
VLLWLWLKAQPAQGRDLNLACTHRHLNFARCSICNCILRCYVTTLAQEFADSCLSHVTVLAVSGLQKAVTAHQVLVQVAAAQRRASAASIRSNCQSTCRTE